ncbi:Mth938-like domain-containing protein [Orrella daihaiensis]|uniref:Mth938-like domain-containing protein n=1 Tax=Orrella daihaiensis TaxID=2782176 RepID=A0ABY4AGM1_9BURK|nr:Mth938-like domain-containing protein [Orrella daihaiensis]UOD49446.1 Mth938-like domain-containing protein [Orrella daihaiensis]
MKLHDDVNPSLNTVTAYGDGFIEINQTRFETAIAFGPEGVVNPWPAHDANDISSASLMQACGLSQSTQDPMAFLDADDDSPVLDPNRPEVLLVGTGERQVMLGADVVGPLLRAGVGVECMSTGAAARTYNILMAEGRRVIAALILEKT